MPKVAEAREHTSVLTRELLEGLRVLPGGLYVDCTVGAGGHAEAVLEASSPGGRLLGIDLDPKAVRAAERRLKRFNGSFVIENDNFANLAEIAARHGFIRVHGVYFDLGISSMQLGEPGRGFSFQRGEEPLDMRMDPRQARTASELVNSYSVEDLAKVLRTYGEEPRSWAIARRIAANRPVETTGQLARLVEGAAHDGGHHRIHPATKVFQALRIWVNNELGNLERALRQALEILGSGGRVAAISFHSLEDRLVKTVFHEESIDCLCPPTTPVCVCGHKAIIRLVTKKVIVPSREEVLENRRSRSAKLRIAEKL